MFGRQQTRLSITIAIVGLLAAVVSVGNALVVAPVPSPRNAAIPIPITALSRGSSMSTPLLYSNWRKRRSPILLKSTNDDESDDNEEISSSNDDDDPNNNKSILDKINDFLDTPILDANNRSNQGALAEFLKEFVRDEPEIAQVTFSVVVVAILALLTKLFLSL